MKVIQKCFRHPKYDGHSKPDLLCRECCMIFINEVKKLTGAMNNGSSNDPPRRHD
jgi:hypothetical protein